MFVFAPLLLLLLLSSSSNAMFEDQVGKADWYRPGLGQITAFHYNGRDAYASTREGVLARFQTRTGKMLWRKVYPLESTIRVMRAGSTLAILTSSSEIHAFSKDTGDMIWSGKTSNSAFDAMFVSDQDDDGQDDLLVVSSDRVELWSGDQATKLWTFDAPTQVRDVAVISKEDIYVAMYENNVLTTQNVALRNGVARGNSKQHEIENVIQGPITIAERSLVMLTKKSELHVLDLKSGSAVVQQLEEGDNTRIESIRRDAPILKVNGVPVFVNLESGEIRELKHSGTATDVVVSKSEQVFVVSADSGEIVVLDANTDKVESRTSIQLENCCGIVTNVFTQIYRKKNDVTSRFRFLLTTSDGTNIMISGEKGETMWIEDGALASVRQVLFTDRAAAAEGIVDEMPSLADRFQSQLETLISSVPSFSLNNNNKDDNNHDTDAFFGFNRIALLRTETGAIYAIETLDGTQIWKTYVSDAKQMFLVNDRTLQVLRRRDGNKDEIVTLNILNGKIVERSGALSFRVKQAVQYHGGALLLRDNMNTVHVFGNNKQDFSDAFMFELDRDQSVFRGLSLRVESDGKIHAVPTWQHVLGSQDDRVVAFTQIDRTRTVGSSARILGDNSVMIRYLNPNLAATISTRGSERLELRVMDTVTGRTVFQQTHTNAASEPCHIVMFENFVVYSYYNIKVQRTEISVVALYDETIGKKDLNGWSTPDCAPHCTSETQSSLKSASKTPIAMTKTYVLAGDGGGIRSLSTTKTSRGITNVDVLVGLSSGRVVAIKKRFLDPRRPQGKPSASDKKEMLVQYHPHLPNMPQQVISYNKTISNLHGIVSSNTKLESTSMVLAYGVDLFFSRVTPSNAFDRLPDSFNTIALFSLLVGLSIAVVMLRRLLREKALQVQWK